jgi:hypothetical protein
LRSYQTDAFEKKTLVEVLFFDDSFLLQEILEAFAFLDHIGQEELDLLIEAGGVLGI